MSSAHRFTTLPWGVREESLDLDVFGQAESVFALANGHIGWRANLEEGEPRAIGGCYLNGVYENRPLLSAESEYGSPETSETLIPVPNGQLIRLLVDDEPLDARYGVLHEHVRELDFRKGTLDRSLKWTSPAGQTVQVRSTRIVSLSHRAVAAICYEVTPIDDQARVVVQSELVADEPPPQASLDPRAGAVLTHPLNGEDQSTRKAGAVLVHKVARSGLRVGSAMDHLVEAPVEVGERVEVDEDLGRFTVTATLQPGQTLKLIKFVGYGWSARRSVSAVRAQAAAALDAALDTGWEGLLQEQRDYLDEFWATADVQVEGDALVQQAVRFGLFHVLQASARAEGRGIGAKGLTGTGYDGHAFWDSEIFVMNLLTYVQPQAVRHALGWRRNTIDQAYRRAEELGLKGAAFPWRTISGAESSGYWPASTAAFHINADIAYAAVRYVQATGDEKFAETVALPILVGTARLWRSLGHHASDGSFRIDGVTGPDEYGAIADNNVYTNLMAKRNLNSAAEYARNFPSQAAELDVDEEETAAWSDAADAMVLLYDHKLGVHPQSAGFTDHQEWDFANCKYPLMSYHPYFDLYRKRVVKQSDLVLALLTCSDEFTLEQKARDFAYYEAITVRDSSLSACIQGVLAAELGHLDLAHDYLLETALVDLRDVAHNTTDGLHLASLAGSWIALVLGFGGFRDTGGRLCFAPRLPAALTRLSFGLQVSGQRLGVDIQGSKVRYTVDSSAVRIFHHGEAVEVRPGAGVELDIPKAPVFAAPRQPIGREPGSRV
ncbi:glycoside hydrolase family 65 protein [Pseudonocardiaceae bacterium YIM PH 21723]|nr:glycoside hydrolase family 65 protein [Pseudonocardiaceae bacterium YIM PH 21723]